MEINGYTRPLDAGEDLAGEIEALRHAGARGVVVEPTKGSRVHLAQLVADATPDDVLIVTSLERIGQVSRSVGTLLARLERGMEVRCLDAPDLDLRNQAAMELLRVLRETHARGVSRGTKAGLATGRAPGRPRTLDDQGVAVAAELHRLGRSYAHIARVLGVSASAVQRALAR